MPHSPGPQQRARPCPHPLASAPPAAVAVRAAASRRGASPASQQRACPRKPLQRHTVGYQSWQAERPVVLRRPNVAAAPL
eukprot:7077532-Prymnesium_polylepis.1